MALQLQDYVAKHGNELKIGSKVFTYLDVATDGEGADLIAIASVKSAKATYHVVLCNNTFVMNRPGAESWCILSPSGRDIARFAIYEGRLLETR